MKTRSISLPGLIALLVPASSGQVLACAACYGDTTGSKMGNAASWGIIAMVIIMFAMLGAIAAFGFYLAYRAKHPLPDYRELLSGDESQPKPGTVS